MPRPAAQPLPGTAVIPPVPVDPPVPPVLPVAPVDAALVEAEAPPPPVPLDEVAGVARVVEQAARLAPARRQVASGTARLAMAAR